MERINMRKIFWFTQAQVEVLDILKKKCKMNNSELVREALKEYAIKYDVEIPNNYNAIDSRG